MNLENQSSITVLLSEDAPKGSILHVPGTKTGDLYDAEVAAAATEGSGVAATGGYSGDRIEMIVAGEAEVLCGDAAINALEDIMSDASGQADVAATGGGSNIALAQALQDGTAPSGGKSTFIRCHVYLRKSFVP
jgi:hypothetical protein